MKKEWLSNLEIAGNTLMTNCLGELEGSRLFFNRAERVVINSLEEQNELLKHNRKTIDLLRSFKPIKIYGKRNKLGEKR